MTRQELLQEIRGLLQKEPDRMYSREEIMNLIGHKGDATLIESLLAELEVSSSLKEAVSDVYATCRGGTVYYKWNR
jgi:hypothetical protein